MDIKTKLQVLRIRYKLEPDKREEIIALSKTLSCSIEGCKNAREFEKIDHCLQHIEPQEHISYCALLIEDGADPDNFPPKLLFYVQLNLGKRGSIYANLCREVAKKRQGRDFDSEGRWTGYTKCPPLFLEWKSPYTKF